MSENSVNPKDVEEFMKSIGFKWDDDAVSWNNGSADGKKFIELSTVQAAFLYQQTLLSRKDEIERCLKREGDAIAAMVTNRRLAELNQLLGKMP